MIYKSLLIFAFVGLFFIQPNEEAIEWREDVKLSWSQFQGVPKLNMSAVAVTASGITFGFSVKETDNVVTSFNTNVYAHFYPNRSWYKKEQGDNRILAHEQLHFDITELYARKFRSEIAKLKVSNTIRTQLKNLHVSINKELAETQNKYDKETNNSLNQEFQDQWNVYVPKELAKLNAYKSKD